MPEAPARTAVAVKMSAAYGSARVYVGRRPGAVEQSSMPRDEFVCCVLPTPFLDECVIFAFNATKRRARSSLPVHAI